MTNPLLEKSPQGIARQGFNIMRKRDSDLYFLSLMEEFSLTYRGAYCFYAVQLMRPPRCMHVSLKTLIVFEL